ncbi:hypothetical protein Q5752_002661 [Cryptotrichosporon argae]
MTTAILGSLLELESLASTPSTSSAGPLDGLIDAHLGAARHRLAAGESPAAVGADLQKQVARAKKDVERALKGWYAGLNAVGKNVDKGFPPNLAGVSKAYSEPPLFATPAARDALDHVVLESLGRRGLWSAVDALQEETGLTYEPRKRQLAEELQAILADMAAGDVSSALAWCTAHAQTHAQDAAASSLTYHLHRTVFRALPAADAIAYARAHLFPYMTTEAVAPLLASALYAPDAPSPYSPPAPPPGADADPSAAGASALGASAADGDVPLAQMFADLFCKAHGLPKEELLAVAVDLGSRGGALHVIEKARKVMGERLGNVRTWHELPMEVPLPPERRYHSVFVCPVSKEQATETNPPVMLSCGHVLAQESFNRLLKGTRRSIKCPYCPIETSQQATQRLYF